MFAYLIFPSYGRAEPSQAIVNKFLNECFNSEHENIEIKSWKLLGCPSEYNKLSEVNKLNGETFRRICNVSWIWRERLTSPDPSFIPNWTNWEANHDAITVSTVNGITEFDGIYRICPNVKN